VPEKRKWVGSAFLGLVGLAALGSGAIGLMYDVVERIYFLAGGVTGLLVASVDPQMWAFERRRSTRFVRQASVPESGENAVVIPCSMGRFWLYLGMLAATVVGLAALGMRQWIVFSTSWLPALSPPCWDTMPFRSAGRRSFAAIWP
jgi:hypothetical protein